MSSMVKKECEYRFCQFMHRKRRLPDILNTLRDQRDCVYGVVHPHAPQTKKQVTGNAHAAGRGLVPSPNGKVQQCMIQQQLIMFGKVYRTFKQQRCMRNKLDRDDYSDRPAYASAEEEGLELDKTDIFSMLDKDSVQ